MNFSSLSFVAVFLPITILAFKFCRSSNQRQALLIIASVIFYGSSGLDNLLILGLSGCINFIVAKFLISGDTPVFRRYRFCLMWVGISFNITLLFKFKIAALLVSGGDGFSTAEDILIPLAISFYTFQQIGFLVSCYKEKITSLKLFDYLFFICFFPQLILGPIVKFEDVIRQLERGALNDFSLHNLTIGLSIFIFGLVKKVLLADQIYIGVERIYSNVMEISVASIDMLYAVIGFQFQVLLDFSAYADMAIGLALIFGIHLPVNFDRPFNATSRYDLWRRWHITFVIFMKTHVFMPLVKVIKIPPVIALCLTGMVSGLWHGLSMTFVLWGLIQTIFMLVSHYRNKWTNSRKNSFWWRVLLGIIFTFALNSMLGIVFRTPNLEGVLTVLNALFSMDNIPGLLGWKAWGMFTICALFIWGIPDTHQLFCRYWKARDYRSVGMRPKGFGQERWLVFSLNKYWALMGAVVVFCIVVMSGSSQRFIYVQF